MDFRTGIDILKAKFSLSHTSRIMLLGSCFTENIGNRLLAYKFPVLLNPFGILYNPLSISNSIRLIINGRMFTQDDLSFHNNKYISLNHHGDFSNADKQKCLTEINDSLKKGINFFDHLSALTITFGTAYVYRLKETGAVVANCHKLPEKAFSRTRLSVMEIVKEWERVIADMLNINPSVKVIFTVSPIRHWRDGIHENQISKSTLLLAIDALKELYPETIDYFPAYEIMMDDLRDYRFYAADMIHPSDVAVEYIWKKFSEAYFSERTEKINADWDKIRLAINHKPVDSSSTSYLRFLIGTLQKIEQFQSKYPDIDCSTEAGNIQFLIDKFKQTT